MADNFKVRECLIEYNKVSYIKEVDEFIDYPVKYDCSLGINLFGCSKHVSAALKDIEINPTPYPNYPYTQTLKAIADFWSPIAKLKTANLRLFNGSVMALEAICKVFIDKGTRVIGHFPQFSEFAVCVQSAGGIYETVDMLANTKCKIDTEMLCDAITPNHSIVYIDNPNNPTGQVQTIEQIASVCLKAKKASAVVIVDEAYGDFITKQESAMSLIEKYDNLIVVRSFSKGYGLAGIRVGYMACSEGIMKYIDKACLPFTVPKFAAHLAEIALLDEEFLEQCRYDITQLKSKLLSGLKTLIFYETDMRVPIMTLVDPKGGNLYEKLRKLGVATEFGIDLGLDESTVRFRITTEIEELLGILNSI